MNKYKDLILALFKIEYNSALVNEEKVLDLILLEFSIEEITDIIEESFYGNAYIGDYDILDIYDVLRTNKIHEDIITYLDEEEDVTISFDTVMTNLSIEYANISGLAEFTLDIDFKYLRNIIQDSVDIWNEKLQGCYK